MGMKRFLPPAFLFREVLRSVRAHWMRFSITALGVAWGGFMLTFMSALLGGAYDHFRREMEQVGPKMIYMGAGVVLEDRVGERAARQVSVDDEDVLRIDALTSIVEVSPNITVWNQVVRHGGRTKLLTLQGWNAAGTGMRNFEFETGRGFTPLEVERAMSVAVLGPEAKDRLFGGARAVGESIRIEGRSFRVVGVTKAKGSQIINNGARDATLVIVPYTTAQRWITRDDALEEWMLTPKRVEEGQQSIRAATRMIALREGFDPDSETAVYSADFWDSFQVIYGMFFAIQFFYVVAGLVTLFVGAVGVMNIMLVVVGERSAEIGLRKAIGACKREVFLQFLFEAMLVAVAAGILGAGLGWVAVRALQAPLAGRGILLPDDPDPVTTLAVIVAMGLVAVVAGVLPALRASRVTPSEALRAL